MSVQIDTSFDAYSDTPSGRDPDSHSPTLRTYHQSLWSKKLPGGDWFTLSKDHPGAYLYHKSDQGEFYLSSDGIGHTYRYVKAMAHIIGEVPKEELDEFFEICSTVGAYVIFPARKIDGKTTINGARGLNSKIRDRFDLTLECIRRHYSREPSPLAETLSRYGAFFDLFESFEGYVRFFLFQDLVSADGRSVNFFMPFRGFDGCPLPASVQEYSLYRRRVTDFITARNIRMATA